MTQKIKSGGGLLRPDPNASAGSTTQRHVPHNPSDPGPEGSSKSTQMKPIPRNTGDPGPGETTVGSLQKRPTKGTWVKDDDDGEGTGTRVELNLDRIIDHNSPKGEAVKAGKTIRTTNSKVK